MGLALVAGCGRLPFENPGQGRAEPPPLVARVGLLGLSRGAAVVEGVGPVNSEAFRQGLRDFGWVAGQNLVIEPRAGEDDQLTEFAAELAGLPVHVILASDPVATRAAMSATSTVPIVFAQGSDPVALGLVTSLARPSANVTGLSTLTPQLQAKRLELLQQAVPGISRVAYLWWTGMLGAEGASDLLRGAAETLGLVLLSVELREPSEVESAVSTASREGADALLVQNTNPVVGRLAARVADLAIRSGLPAAGGVKDFTVNGGLMTYGVSVPGQFRRAAYYVDRILKGAKPADLPVEQPREFEFVINLKTAQALGLTIPPSVLAQATEVLQ
jgi:putative ABC transport system substrate-binding protein